MKEWLAQDQETPLYTSEWSAGIGRPAGLYWLDGRCILAGQGTRAEVWLLGRGAVAVGTLRFNRDPAESSVDGGRVDVVRAGALADVPPPRN